MARLTDPERLQCYLNALANWRFEGYIRLTPFAEEAFKRLKLGMPERQFRQLLYEYVQRGGEIDEVKETRPEWSDWTYHYDLRPIINGRTLYVESRLDYKDPHDPDDPLIVIVNIHDA